MCRWAPSCAGERRLNFSNEDTTERLNPSIRTFMRRFTRLAIGFSKKLDNLVAATALHVGVYNFVRRHRSLDGCTPAMAAGVVPSLWSWDDFFDAVTETERQREQREKNRRLLERMWDA